MESIPLGIGLWSLHYLVIKADAFFLSPFTLSAPT